MKRNDKLLTEVADGFLDGMDRLTDRDWLSENHVTLHECMGLAEQIGTLIHGYVRAPKDVQMKLLLLAATRDTNQDPAGMLAHLDLLETTRRITRELQRMNTE